MFAENVWVTVVVAIVKVALSLCRYGDTGG